MEENTQTQVEDATISETLNMRPAVTSKWARRQRFLYIVVIMGVLIVLGGYLFTKSLYVPPSCFDGKQNQDEVGIDCGGISCSFLCGTQVRDLNVNWAETVRVSDGLYDVAASVENPNSNAGVKNLSYIFKIYDDNNILLAEKAGKTFINPRDNFIIFESGIQITDGSPQVVVVEFDENLKWVKIEEDLPRVTVKNKKLLNTRTSPRLNATLLNNSIDDFFDLEITAVIYNKSGNVVAVSSTYEKVIKKDTSKDIFFTWPSAFAIKPEGSCTAPANSILVFDRSGSMGFTGQNPPQPLTSAKNAALAFVEGLQPVDKTGLVSFATTASNPIDQKLTLVRSDVNEAIKEIKIFTPTEQQYTNLGDGIEKAIRELVSEQSGAKINKAIIVLTDGVASRPLNPKDETDEKYPEDYANEKAALAQVNGISVYVIGLGELVNEEFLKDKIATIPDYYYKAATSAQLKGIYKEISQVVCAEETFIIDIAVHLKSTS